MFERAESLHMSVAKVLTGQDVPLSNIEMALHNTYRLVKHKLGEQKN